MILNFLTVIEQFDNYVQHLQPMQDSTEEVLSKLSGFRQHIESILLKHRSSVIETMLETRKDVKSLEIVLSRQMQETVRSEVKNLVLIIIGICVINVYIYIILFIYLYLYYFIFINIFKDKERFRESNIRATFSN